MQHLKKSALLLLSILSFNIAFIAQETCVNLSLLGEQDFASNTDYPPGSVLYSENGIQFIKIDEGFVTSEGGDFLHWANGISVDLTELPYENRALSTTYAIGYELTLKIDDEVVLDVNSVLSVEDTLVFSASGVEVRVLLMMNNYYDIYASGEFNSLIIISSSGGVFEACVQPYVANALMELETASLTVYPNPVMNQLLIQGEFNKTPLAIYNLQAELIYSGNYSSGERIDVKNLEAGMYFIQAAGARASFIKE